MLLKRFLVRDSQPCWVTWTYSVLAENEDDALDRYYNGDHGPSFDPPEIGDCLDYAGNGGTEVEPEPAPAYNWSA